MNTIKDHLSKEEDVQLRGFCIFRVREKNKRMGRNPKTGKEVEIKERRIINLKPLKELKKRAN